MMDDDPISKGITKGSVIVVRIMLAVFFVFLSYACATVIWEMLLIW